MRLGCQVLSWLSLAGTVLPSMLFFGDVLSLDQAKLATLIATIVWFVATPVWMGRPKPDATFEDSTSEQMPPS